MDEALTAQREAMYQSFGNVMSVLGDGATPEAAYKLRRHLEQRASEAVQEALTAAAQAAWSQG